MRTSMSTLVALVLVGSLAAAACAQDPSPPASPGSGPTGSESAATTDAAWPHAVLRGARSVAAGPETFVVVGSTRKKGSKSRIWTSVDGSSWSSASPTPGGASPDPGIVTAFGDGFAIVGSDGRRVTAWRSLDGLTWEQGSVEGSREGRLEPIVRDVTAGPSGLLALAHFIGQDLGAQHLWKSTDGLAWEKVAFPEAEGVVWGSLVGLPDGYLLMGMNASDESPELVWRSSDGEAWEPVEGPADAWLLDAAAGEDGLVVAVGGSRAEPTGPGLWVTPDLASWERVYERPGAKEEDELHSIDRTGSGFIATGSASGCPNDPEDYCPMAQVLVSPDGRIWTESTGPDGLPGPDANVGFLQHGGVASLDDATVVLGQPVDSPVRAWEVPTVTTE